MNIHVTETLDVTVPGAPPVHLAPSQAFELAERLVRTGIRVAMLEEAGAVEREQSNAEPPTT